MIENRTYTSPRYGRDTRGRYRSWPITSSPTAPEDLLPSWAAEVPTEPLPRLVEPAPLVDPLMEVGGDV